MISSLVLSQEQLRIVYHGMYIYTAVRTSTSMHSWGLNSRRRLWSALEVHLLHHRGRMVYGMRFDLWSNNMFTTDELHTYLL